MLNSLDRAGQTTIQSGSQTPDSLTKADDNSADPEGDCVGIMRTIAMSFQHTVTEWPLHRNSHKHLWEMEGTDVAGRESLAPLRDRPPVAWGTGEVCGMALGGTRKVGIQVLKAEKPLESHHSGHGASCKLGVPWAGRPLVQV